MPLVVAPLEEADIPTLAIVDEAAMAGWPYAEAMMEPGTARRVHVENWLRSGWGKDPSQTWLKVIDPDTNELIAGALWIADLNRPQLTAEERIEARLKAEKALEDDPNINAMWKRSRLMGMDFDEEFVGDAPRYILGMVVTHPKHQRRGAGGMLVEWGCKKADEHGVMCVLTASEAGLVGYLKHGFEITKIDEMDLRPYGYEHTELRRYMIRPAKTAS